MAPSARNHPNRSEPKGLVPRTELRGRSDNMPRDLRCGSSEVDQSHSARSRRSVLPRAYATSRTGVKNRGALCRNGSFWS